MTLLTMPRWPSLRRGLLAVAVVLALAAGAARWVHANGGWDCLRRFGQDNLELGYDKNGVEKPSPCLTAEPPEHLRYEPGRKPR